MELSIFVARILALYYLAVGVGLLSGQLNHKKLIDDFEKSQGLTLVTGFFLLVIGAVLVQYHNIWVKDWTVLITIVSWAVLIKGVLLITTPRSFLSFSRQFVFNQKNSGIVVIGLGLLFGYFGFVA